MMAKTNVNIDPQEVSNGIAMYETSTTTFTTAYNAALAKIESLAVPATWGDDEPGQGFSSTFTDGRGTTVRADSAVVVEQATSTGSKVKTAVEGSLTSDQAQANTMKDIGTNKE